MYVTSLFDNGIKLGQFVELKVLIFRTLQTVK